MNEHAMPPRAAEARIDECCARMHRDGIVAVLRSPDVDAAVSTARRLAENGVTVMEVTFSVPDASAAIAALASDPRLLVGAGTVLREEQATAALDAGAAFLVSPVNPAFLIPSARAVGAVAVPGASTPQEIWTAAQAGAPIIKVFPADQLGGPAYLRSLRAPLAGIRLVPSGGVGMDDVAGYAAAGAWAVSLGSALISAEDTDVRRVVRAWRDDDPRG